jgi:Domain of unknown function (DUF4190)
VPLDNADAPLTATTSPGAAPGGSPIENEIPAYRAISPGAIFSLILGILSFFSYTSLWFLALSIGAVVIGALSMRKIRRMPDILTGEKFAQAGIFLGLVFGLTASTISTVQQVIRMRRAEAVARSFERVIKEGTIEDCLWYSQHPERRKGLTPKKLAIEMKSQSPQNVQMMEMELKPLRDLKAHADEPNARIHFLRIEGVGDPGTALEAEALYEVHSPQSKTPGDKDTFALAIVHQVDTNRKLEWWCDKVIFPYKPASYVAPEKPVDDGHGHGGGGAHSD